MADAVDGRHEAAVRDGVTALNGFPRTMLSFAVFLFLARMPADGRRIEKNLRALHRCESRGFGIPLIPADEHADLAVARLPSLEPKIAGREIKFLVEQRVIRDVHLPVDAEQRAVSVNDRGGVVINAAGAFLK